LGAGKTCFTRGIARALGITENVTSPTYTIVSEYAARLNGQAIPLYHIDAYRLSGDEDFETTGAGELVAQAAGQAAGVAVIEWSERIPRSIPAGAITVEIEITGPESRLLRIRDEPIIIDTGFYFVFPDPKTKKSIVEKRRNAGKIMDISIGGCSIKTTTSVNQGQRVKVEFIHNDGSIIAALGEVLRITHNGINTIIHAHFLKVPRRSLNSINAMVYEYEE